MNEAAPDDYPNPARNQHQMLPFIPSLKCTGQKIDSNSAQVPLFIFSMTFKELNLVEPILKALEEKGYETPTPIQGQAIPHALKGRDILGCAQTGTGKTAAFSIPILQLLENAPDDRRIKALILTPTRELAIQIEESLNAYGRNMRLRNFVIFGGVSQRPQEKALQRGVDILVATPGRLLDLMNQGIVDLQYIQFFILDEADRMLDMGFINDVKKVIAKIPEKRQTLFFSATMPPEIAELANRILVDPIKVEVTPPASTVEKIDQSVYFVPKNRKRNLLLHLLENADIENALVFTRTKHGANRVVKELSQRGVRAMAIHGNKSQTARQKALSEFKAGNLRVLVATDIAARGIDIDGLTHVINFDLPNISESYVHRIGRTGRAGAEGIAIAFCDFDEAAYLQDIQRLIGLKVPVVDDHPYPLEEMPDFSKKLKPPKKEQRAPRPPRGDRRGGGGRRGDARRGDRRSDASGRRPQRGERRSGEGQGDKPERNQERAEGQGRGRGRGRGGRGRNANRRAEGNPEGGAPKPQRTGGRSRNEGRKPDSEKKKTDNGADGGDDSSWSRKIFKETSGKKGFIIKSDRDEKSRKKNYGGGGGRRRPPGGGGRKR